MSIPRESGDDRDGRGHGSHLGGIPRESGDDHWAQQRAMMGAKYSRESGDDQLVIGSFTYRQEYSPRERG